MKNRVSLGGKEERETGDDDSKMAGMAECLLVFWLLLRLSNLINQAPGLFTSAVPTAVITDWSQASSLFPSPSLIDLHGGNLPVCLAVCISSRRIVRHIRTARAAILGCALRSPNRCLARPITTKCNVKNLRCCQSTSYAKSLPLYTGQRTI